MKYFVTLAIDKVKIDERVKAHEKASVSLLKSNTDGKFVKEFTIMDYTRWIKDDLRGYFANNFKLFQDMSCKIEDLYNKKDERIRQAEAHL